jgi:hypothetical protein
MIRRTPLLVIALVIAAIVGGCGSSSSTTSTTSTASTATTPTSTGAGTSSTPALTGVSAAQAVELCKKEIAAQTTLPASAKSKLEAVCEKAAKGDQTAVKKAAQEVCEEVINASPLPSGSAKEQALAACKAK